MARALEENLRRTAIPVEIPEEHLLLLEITDHLHGVRRQTEALLREIHHRYAGWAQTLEDLHRHAMGDFYHYNNHPRGTEALEIFMDLYARVAAQAVPDTVRHDGVRRWLSYAEKIARESGQAAQRNTRALAVALARLREDFAIAPAHRVTASAGLKRLGIVLAASPGSLGTTNESGSSASSPAGIPGQPDAQWPRELLDRTLGLLADALDETYASWLERDDPALWLDGDDASDRPRAGGLPPGPGEEDPLPVAHAALTRYQESLRELDRSGPLVDCSAELLTLPDNGQLVRCYLERGRALPARETVGGARQRIRWFSRTLKQEGLTSLHGAALGEIRRCCAAVLTTAGEAEGQRFVEEVLELIRAGGFTSSVPGLDLVGTLGREVIATGKPPWVETVVDGIVDLDFQYPAFSGYTEEWKVRVNPAHLHNVRTYLAIIEADPGLARRLVAALVTQLKLGGTFLADTDLFQRDISSLLSRPIEPVYDQVKHLLKLFPAYFTDIGAEGDLRVVSTQLDEIRGRADPLCHFIRKLSHVESNPLLVPFVEDVARFWADGDPTHVRRYLPDKLYESLDIQDPNYQSLHRIFGALAQGEGGIEALFGLETTNVEAKLRELTEEQPTDLEKARLLFKVREEIARKYRLDSTGLLERLATCSFVDASRVVGLGEALQEQREDQSLEILLEILEELQAVICTPGAPEPAEDIYLKRHVAVGIPSMYGSYREKRFEAIGLSFRVEALTTAMFARRLAAVDLSGLDAEGLSTVADWLRLLIRALRVDGCASHGLDASLEMLDQAVSTPGVTRHQFINVFQLFSRAIERLVQQRFLAVYEDTVERVVERRAARGLQPDSVGANGPGSVVARSEELVRELIADTFGLSLLDSLVARVLRGLAEQGQPTEAGDPGTVRGTPAPAERWAVPLSGASDERDGILHLGNKGYMLRRLTQHGFPVPPGFILTTELFKARSSAGQAWDPRRSLAPLLEDQVRRIEAWGTSRFGDPSRPLLLSVRGGAPVSMPGMLDSFLNVGINQEIAAGVAALRGRPWAAWDAYRRFLQFWGMSQGVDRDLFDDLIRAAKRRASVPKKALLPWREMRALAGRYRELLGDHGVSFIDDPFEQLLACVEMVVRSWDSDNARLYRRELQIAESWGTAVIVQSMVLGNLHDHSGTGVALTRPARAVAGRVDLHGDFIIQGQGDDVVSGLVATFPLAEGQRDAEADVSGRSLESDFPAVHARLAEIANALIFEHGFAHQELEFTFESERPEDVYVLQARDKVLAGTRTVAAFLPTEALEHSRLGTGIGAGGGALSGRVAQSAEEIERLSRQFPGDPIILLRPDTVPDDVHLVLRAEGVLTALGGATSHAAVITQLLGKTCVVGCRQLEIVNGAMTLGGRPLTPGDHLSISGLDGSVYLGSHAVVDTKIRGRG
jgi:pyruvate,orthophosphate dikinase